jgi:HEAT repeat protein
MEDTSEAIARLVAELQSADEFGRAQASFALGMLGEPAVTPLVRLLRHDDRDVRVRAAWALGVIGAPALPALTALAEGGDAKLRVEAIRILGVVGEGRALDQLFHALTDPSEQVAQRAAIALGRIGDPRAYHPLVTATRHPSPDVRYAACAALAHMGAVDALDVLRAVAAEDQGVTSWGTPVAEAARLAVQEITAGRSERQDRELAPVSDALRQQPNVEIP